MIYPWIVRHINFPLGLFLRGHGRFYRHYKKIEKIQWLAKDQIKKIQIERLQKLLSLAHERIPYWKTIFIDRGFNPYAIKDIEMLKQLPVMTKRDLQINCAELLDQSFPKHKLIENASGGSTGEPTLFYQHRERNYRRAMEQIRHDRWSGWEIGDANALLWGANHDFNNYQRFLRRIHNTLFFRCIPLDAFQLTKEKMVEYLTLLQKRKPTMIQAYAQAIFLFAQTIQKNDYAVKPLQLKGIVSSAEQLFPWQKDIVEKVFNCKVFNRYGSREVGLIASQCGQSPYLHINSDNLIVEILRADDSTANPGERGRVVVTDLWNTVMPFVRYDTGDIGALRLENCPCGRGLPLMESPDGRVADMITLPNGTIIHGEYFTHLFYGISGIRQFQLVQTEKNKLVFSVVKDVNVSEHALDQVMAKLKDFIHDPNVQIEVAYVDTIPLPQSGKHRFTISKVPS